MFNENENMEISVLEFGAYGDGCHDDYEAFQNALNSGARTITIPQGIYHISQTLKVSSNTSIVADRSAKIVMKSIARRKRNEFLLSNSDTANGNINISISGGIWDGNNTAPENRKPDLFDKEGYSGALLNFVNVEHLTLKNMVMMNSVTFYARLCKVHFFNIENIDFGCDTFGANQDGLHIGGDVKHGTVKSIRAISYGQTNDDMIALNADDSIERVENLDLCRGSIEDITFENIFCENCHTIIRMLSVTAKIKNIRFKNIFGGFRCNAINADAARYCRTPLFAESEYPYGVGKISNIDIQNFACYPVTVQDDFAGTKTKPRVALLLESHADRFRISNFRYLCDSETVKRCPALVAKNLCREKICADGKTYVLTQKSDSAVIDTFEQLFVDLI